MYYVILFKLSIEIISAIIKLLVLPLAPLLAGDVGGVVDEGAANCEDCCC